KLPFARIEDMAAHYVDCMLRVQPSGPYVIAGYSFGGLVALEMARRVAASGQRVEELMLFDTYPPSPEIYAMTQDPANAQSITLILANYLAGHGPEGDVIKASDLDGVPARLHFALLTRLIRERGRTHMSEDDIFGYLRGSSEVNDYASQAYATYRLQPFDA